MRVNSPPIDPHEKALEVARRAHTGQLDKAGRPYIDHPMRVAARLEDPVDQIVALLHDVVEDSDVTLADLFAAGFAPDVVEAVGVLTRRADETYQAFVDRIAAHPRARRVKLADLADNTDPNRIPHPTARDERRTEKYQRAHAWLSS